MHLCADPMYRERHQANPHIWIETFNGFHQANVAFLNEITLRQAIATVAGGDARNEAQMREYQMACGFDVIVLAKALCQLPLLIR